MDRIHNICKPNDIEVVIFHHPCMDGFASAFVAQLYLNKNNKDIKLIPKSLDGKPINIEDIKDKNVLMVDIVCENFAEINEKANSLIILDHHKTNEIKLKDVDYAYFDMNKSGVGIAWEYFYEFEDKDKTIPLFLDCIQDRDIWTWKIEKSRNFCDAIYELVDFSDFKFKIFYNLYDDENEFEKYYNIGKTLNEIKLKNIKSLVKYHSNKYKITINETNYEVYIYNITSNIISDLGNYVMDNLDCDFVILWSYNHNEEQYSYSLRSKDEKTDVGEIAKIFNGGGHRNASGLRNNKNPKELFNSEKLIYKTYYMCYNK
jgi:oligoribonuclease NrnB/cAMP/cGMP phosphodiesterase (DHH superfamily)